MSLLKLVGSKLGPAFVAMYLSSCTLPGDTSIKFANIELDENFGSSGHTRDLVVAACAADVAKLNKAVSAGALINEPGSHNLPPIFWMLANNCERGAELLLQRGARVDLKIDQDVTPLWFAAREGGVGLLKLLLDAGASIDSVSKDATPLVEAAAVGRWENVRYLVSRGADVNWASTGGYTAAKFALARGAFSEVGFLLDSGYRFNLDQLARMVRDRALPQDQEQLKSRESVISKLGDLGVTAQ